MAVKRWTDEMLDKLADKVDNLTDRVSELTERMDDTHYDMKGLKLTTDALLQLATQSQRKADA